jgi:hypothetical protein
VGDCEFTPLLHSDTLGVPGFWIVGTREKLACLAADRLESGLCFALKFAAAGSRRFI